MGKYVAFLSLCILAFCSCGESSNDQAKGSPNTPAEVVYVRNEKKLKKKADEALLFCSNKGMSTDVCLLLDLSIHSGRQRFFVWDFHKDSVVLSGLVSHGCGRQPWGKDYSKTQPQISNKEDSHCSSLGKYKMGERGYSQWGINVKYLMHGLEAGNNNALRRQIVFHGWDAISDEEVYPAGTPEGWGCPAVSNVFMASVDALLRNSKRPVLMWIYQ